MNRIQESSLNHHIEQTSRDRWCIDSLYTAYPREYVKHLMKRVPDPLKVYTGDIPLDDYLKIRETGMRWLRANIDTSEWVLFCYAQSRLIAEDIRRNITGRYSGYANQKKVVDGLLARPSVAEVLASKDHESAAARLLLVETDKEAVAFLRWSIGA